MQAYPRRCGEHSSGPQLRTTTDGLPPQVRGAPISSFGPPADCGLTPAGAGSTSAIKTRSRPRAAYPRRCGEHVFLLASVRLPTGLPPQVRGAPGWLVHNGSRVTAYPRRCGEHVTGVGSVVMGKGLPPQVRGARTGHRRLTYPMRLTPAGAGSTNATTTSTSSSGAYPRRCGEHSVSVVRVRVIGGLPPQVRGARESARCSLARPGLTPAGAGSTDCRGPNLSLSRAYPRRCGEHRS